MEHCSRWLIAAFGSITLAAALALLALGSPPSGSVLAQGNTIYVDADATGGNDGTSWQDAYTTLQPALEEAALSDEIWVAAGTYTPTHEFSPGDPRSATFQLKNGVALYGGFDPCVGDTGWEDRDWVINIIILSGDIGVVGDAGDNSYHVFYHPLELTLDGSAVLDGFTVSGGNADGGAWPNYLGGGMANWYSSSPTVSNCTFSDNSAHYGGGMENAGSPTVTNCTFSNNSATSIGGGMHNSGSSPVVANCTFSDNSASDGGGMYNEWASPVVTNCTFSGNSAAYDGGGMRNAGSSPVVTNCTFSGNSAGYNGGGMYNEVASPVVTNCILWGDGPQEIWNQNSQPSVTYSDIQGGSSGTGNIDDDPLFVDSGSGDYHLGPGSPCLDAGTNDAPNLPEFDFEGNPRVMDGDRNGTAVVDMGVDEAFWHVVYLPLIFRGY
ncbi:MAG TPA: right-handed parallel beta-helix repeat-containing protein [Anaerolineae bacterium]|nr:right-handed parallel beta-helix repeat-containing protein [Anaerolineae bacterium]